MFLKIPSVTEIRRFVLNKQILPWGLLLLVLVIYNLHSIDQHLSLERNPNKKPRQLQTPVDLSAEIETKQNIHKHHNEIRPFKPPTDNLLPVSSPNSMKMSKRIQQTRRNSIESYCEGFEKGGGESLAGRTPRFYVDEQHKLLYCYVPKAASTNLKRLMLIFSGQVDPKDYYSVSRYMVHFNNSMPRVEAKNTEELTELGLGDYTKFLFTRHPFERLVSAYYDKFTDKNRTEVIPFAPDPLSNLSEDSQIKASKKKTKNVPKVKIDSFPLRFGTKIIKKYRPNASERSLKEGNDVTPSEFVSFLIDEWAERDVTSVNEHWRSTFDLCHPCSIQYDIIGKFETMQEDVDYLIQKFKENKISNLFHEYKPYATSSLVKKFMEQINDQQWEDLIRIYEDDLYAFGYEPEV